MRKAWIAAAVSLVACRGGEHRAADEHDDHGKGERAEPAGRSDSVRLSPEAIERNQIRVAAVAMEPFTGGVEIPAEVQLIPDRVAHVTSLVAGQVVEARVSLGDRVEKGAVLATLRSVELGQARSEQSRAAAAVESARANYERQQTLEREGIGSQRALQEARAAFEQSRADLAGARDRLGVYGGGGTVGAAMALRAPIAGTIIERHATAGEISKVDDPLFVVADTSRVWVLGRVYEQDVGRVTAGASVSVHLAAYPDRSWKGTLSQVASVLDERTRTLPVRVELDNPDGVLRPGLFGTLTLATDPSAPLMPVVPESAVQTVRGRELVFVPGEQAGEFRAVSVRVAGRDHGRVSIEDGLAAGAEVVVRGAFVLKSELLRDEMGEGHAH